MAKVSVGEMVTELTTGFCGLVVERSELLDGVVRCMVRPQALTGRETVDELAERWCLEEALLTEEGFGRVGRRKPMDARRQRKVIRALWDLLRWSNAYPSPPASVNERHEQIAVGAAAERCMSAFGYTLLVGEYVRPTK